jgi:hypothetical protein
MTARQLHVSNGTRVQTLAASEGLSGGITFLSTFSTGEPVEINIPAAARDWLIRMARPPRRLPIVPGEDALREEADRDGS